MDGDSIRYGASWDFSGSQLYPSYARTYSLPFPHHHVVWEHRQVLQVLCPAVSTGTTPNQPRRDGVVHETRRARGQEVWGGAPGENPSVRLAPQRSQDLLPLLSRGHLRLHPLSPSLHHEVMLWRNKKGTFKGLSSLYLELNVMYFAAVEFALVDCNITYIK